MTIRLGLFAGLLICFPGFLAQAQSSPANAELYGRVKGAEGPTVVYLEASDENPTRYYDGYRVDAEKDGAFRFEDVRPGTYRLWATAPGFVAASADADKLTLAPGEKHKNVSVEMVRERELCGRVTEDGKPKTTWVDAYRLDPEFNTLTPVFIPSTSPDGSYHFASLEPGSYYLQGYMTWYPGSFSFNEAKPVTVGPDASATTCSLDIPLQYTGCSSKKVVGEIARTDSNAEQRYHVLFLERNGIGGWVPTTIAMNQNDLYKAGDTFTAQVCPGDYDVVLSDERGVLKNFAFPSHKVIFDSRPITVGDHDISGLVLAPKPLGRITGEVHFESIRQRDACPGMGGQEVSILREGDAQSQSARLDDKNHFEMKNVAPGEYSIFLGSYRRESVYVKSIAVDGKTIEGRRFSIPQPGETRVDIILSGDTLNAAGHISPEARTTKRWEDPWSHPKASVAGKVTGNDYAGFDIKLVSARFNSDASQAYVTHPSAEGSFRFDTIDPGVYTLRAQRKGWVPSEYGARETGEKGVPIVVGRGDHVEGLMLSPPQTTQICGQVTDASGSPLSNLRIFPQTFDTYLDSRFTQEAITTDAEGRFHIENLLPGLYYFSHSAGIDLAYFSSDGTLSAAKPMRISVGEDIGCKSKQPLQLRVPSAVRPRYSISGTVSGDLPKKDGDRFWVSLLWDVQPPQNQAFVAYGKLDAEHKFKLDNVPNGKFVMQIHSAYGPEPRTWSGPCGPVSHLLAAQKIEVHDGDRLDVQIAPWTLPSVSGTVHFENMPEDWTGFKVGAEGITLSHGYFCNASTVKLNDDGSFTIDPMDVGEYLVGLQQLRNPLYVRAVRLNGQELKDRRIRLQPGDGAKLEVFVSGKGGELTASVAPDPKLPRTEPWTSEPCAGPTWPQYQLLLLPDPLESGHPDSIQEFVIGGHAVGDIEHPTVQAGSIPPGRYRVVLAEHLLQSAPFAPDNDSESNLRFWKAIAPLGEPVTMQPGAKLEITLTDRTVDVEREAARIGLPLDRNSFDGP